MRCEFCGREKFPEEADCPCRQSQDEVKVLTPEEREGFRGITINDERAERIHFDYRSDDPRSRIYVRQFTFGSGGGGLWVKLLIFAVLAGLLFVFLPFFLFFIVPVTLVWLVSRMLRG